MFLKMPLIIYHKKTFRFPCPFKIRHNRKKKKGRLNESESVRLLRESFDRIFVCESDITACVVFNVACRKQWHINPYKIRSGEITYRLTRFFIFVTKLYFLMHLRAF